MVRASSSKPWPPGPVRYQRPILLSAAIRTRESTVSPTWKNLSDGFLTTGKTQVPDRQSSVLNLLIQKREDVIVPYGVVYIVTALN